MSITVPSVRLNSSWVTFSNDKTIQAKVTFLYGLTGQDHLRDGHTEQRVARRCRILLAMADPDTIVDELANQVAVTRTGIWYVCRRFEAQGLDSIYDAPRSGRPREISALERVERLAERDEVVLALDDKPSLQALERAALPWTGPGQFRRQEFEYVRHGTVNFLVALAVHSGQMQGWCLDRNDSEHLRQVLPDLLRRYRKARRIHLIWDGGPSHTAEDTLALLRSYRPQLRVLFTPAHASWLNQAGLLLRSFEAHYLQLGSWKSRRELIEHLYDSAPEYNRLFAHPIQWSWTRRNLRDWVAEREPGLC